MKLLLSFVLSVLAAAGTHAQESRSGGIPQAVLAALNSLPQAVQAALNSPACKQLLDDCLESKECQADLSATIKSISQGGLSATIKSISKGGRITNSEGAALYECAGNNNGNYNDKVSDSKSLMSLRAAVRSSSSSSSSSMTGALAGKTETATAKPKPTAPTPKPTFPAPTFPAPTFPALTDETFWLAAQAWCVDIKEYEGDGDEIEAARKAAIRATYGPIARWDVSKVTSMSFMLDSQDCNTFNEPIGKWDTSAVTDMGYMFQGSSMFNQNIGGWNTTSVQRGQSMFRNDSAFNQKLCWTRKPGSDWSDISDNVWGTLKNGKCT
jgi:surface protein